MVPSPATIIGHIKTAITADDHVPTVVGIDPQVVRVCMDTPPKVACEGDSTILGLKLRDAKHVDALGIAGVNADLAKVHWPHIE